MSGLWGVMVAEAAYEQRRWQSLRRGPGDGGAGDGGNRYSGDGGGRDHTAVARHC